MTGRIKGIETREIEISVSQYDLISLIFQMSGHPRTEKICEDGYLYNENAAYGIAARREATKDDRDFHNAIKVIKKSIGLDPND
jgi:hypothetical protein